MALAVIMAGGQGERFWPLTHSEFPKYKIRLDGKVSLLQKTYRRLLSFYPKKNIYVVTTADHTRFIQEELPAILKTHIFSEPSRRNTAAAITFSCAKLSRRYGAGEVVTFFPADHLIKEETHFRKTLRRATGLAKAKDCLVAVGVKPSFACTGYGYLERGDEMAGFKKAYWVKSFREKPSRKLAESYLRSKRFYWNGGIFTWRLQVFEEALKEPAPVFHNFFMSRGSVSQNYAKLPKLSIDLALLEKTKNLAVVEAQMDWCDMGSWDMFFEKGRKNPNASVIEGHCRHKDSENILLLNFKKSPLVAFGVSDLMAVQTDQGTLICKRGRSEEAAILLKRDG